MSLSCSIWNIRNKHRCFHRSLSLQQVPQHVALHSSASRILYNRSPHGNLRASVVSKAGYNEVCCDRDNASIRSPSRKFHFSSRRSNLTNSGNITADLSSDSYSEELNGTLIGFGASHQPDRIKYLSLATWANDRRKCSDGRRTEGPLRPRIRYDREWTKSYHELVYGGKLVSLNDYPLNYFNKNDLLSREYTGPRLTRSRIRMAWLRLKPSRRVLLWRALTLWCLQHSPGRALQLLIAALEGTYISIARHVVGECMQNICLTYLTKRSKLDPGTFHTILRAVRLFIQRGRCSRLVPFVPDQVCFFLFKHSNEQQFVSLMHEFEHRNVQLHANTLLQAVDRSVEMGDVTLALRILRKVAQSGFDLRKPQVQWACAKMVRLRFDPQNQFVIRMKIVHDMLEMGIQPDRLVHKAILYSAFEDKQTEFGIQYFLSMEDTGVRPDSFMYNILIHGAMQSLQQSDVRMLVRKAERDESNLQDLELTTTILNAIARRRGSCYGALLRFYKRHWDLEPLKQLGIADETEEPNPLIKEAVRGKMPMPTTLSQMLCAYLRANQWRHCNAEIYTRYQEHIQKNHPLISRMGLTDHVANAFLLCFSRDAKTLSVCATVMRDMLDASQSQRLSIKRTRSEVTAAAPTAQSWSLLAAAYFRHGQKQAAEKVLDLMRERGIERTQVTWNTIIDGYATLQDVGKAVDAIIGMHKVGLDISKRTIRSLRKIVDREQMSSAFANVTGPDTQQTIMPEQGTKIEDTSSMVQSKQPEEPDHQDAATEISRLQEQYSKVRRQRET